MKPQHCDTPWPHKAHPWGGLRPGGPFRCDGQPTLTDAERALLPGAPESTGSSVASESAHQDMVVTAPVRELAEKIIAKYWDPEAMANDLHETLAPPLEAAFMLLTAVHQLRVGVITVPKKQAVDAAYVLLERELARIGIMLGTDPTGGH